MGSTGVVFAAVCLVLVIFGTEACDEVTYTRVDIHSMESVILNVTGGNKSYTGCLNLVVDAQYVDAYDMEVRIVNQPECSGNYSFTVTDKLEKAEKTSTYVCARPSMTVIRSRWTPAVLRLRIYDSKIKQAIKVTFRGVATSFPKVNWGTCRHYRVTVYDGRSTVKRYMSSHGYPAHYDPNTDNCYVLETSSSRVRLEVIDFELEQSPRCTKDYLEIRDGRYSTDRLLARLCGNRGFHRFTSTGRSLFLRFKTDSTIQGKGYELKYYRYKTDHPFNFLYGGVIIGVVFVIIICATVVRRRTLNQRRMAARANRHVQTPAIINSNAGVQYAPTGGITQGNVNMAYTPGVGVNMQNQYGFTPQYGGYAVPPAGGAPAEGELPPSYETIYSTTNQPAPSKS